MAAPTIYRSEAARHEIETLYDRARERLPFPTTERMVSTRFGDAHILQAGPEDGPPVVVFQGGNVVNPLTLAWFAPLVDRFRIHAPDTIGQPGKSAGARVSANDASLGEWAVDVLDGLGLAAPAVVGISYGGGVVLRLAALAPERIGRAILVVPAGIADVPLGSMLSLAAGYLGYRAIARRSFVESTVRRLSGGDPDPLFVESTALAFRGTALDTEMPRNATTEELRRPDLARDGHRRGARSPVPAGPDPAAIEGSVRQPRGGRDAPGLCPHPRTGVCGCAGRADPAVPRGRCLDLGTPDGVTRSDDQSVNTSGSPNCGKSSGPKVVISAIRPSTIRRTSNLNARWTVSPGTRR